MKELVFSKSYPVERGVKQGSVLSPALFVLVMDPLLSKLQSSEMDLFINYAGGFLHADDICTVATSPEFVEEQVITFVEETFRGSIGAFQGDLNPLSTRSVIETCVLPVLLQRKLTFLRKQLTSDSVNSNRLRIVAMKSLSDDPESVKDCRELESQFNTDFTTEILTDADPTY